MRLPGYCTECRRFKQVCVKMSLAQGIMSGICAMCEEKNDPGKPPR